MDSTTLSRDKSLELLSSMLKNECLLGNVVRQELVSMIPALLLDVKASHLVIISSPDIYSRDRLMLLHLYCNLQCILHFISISYVG